MRDVTIVVGDKQYPGFVDGTRAYFKPSRAVDELFADYDDAAAEPKLTTDMKRRLLRDTIGDLIEALALVQRIDNPHADVDGKDIIERLASAAKAVKLLGV